LVESGWDDDATSRGLRRSEGAGLIKGRFDGASEKPPNGVLTHHLPEADGTLPWMKLGRFSDGMATARPTAALTKNQTHAKDHLAGTSRSNFAEPI
jgi:hypothetical protein